MDRDRSAVKIPALLRQTNILQKLRHLCAILNFPTMITGKHKYDNSDGNLSVCVKHMVVAWHRCEFHTMTKICSLYHCAAATLFTACLSRVHSVTVLHATNHKVCSPQCKEGDPWCPEKRNLKTNIDYAADVTPTWSML